MRCRTGAASVPSLPRLASPVVEVGVGATMAPHATTNQLRRARLGIRGYLVLYAAGLGSMLLGGSVVHAVAQPDLVRWVFRSVGAPCLSAAYSLPLCAIFFSLSVGWLRTQWRPLVLFFWGGVMA